MTTSGRRAILALRVVVAGLLTIHGWYRMLIGSPWEFGDFLASVPLPLPHFTAWVLTVLEAFGGPVLALGWLVRPLCACFALELSVGIALVHAKEGWFVVGGGRGGAEYSVLLIVCLLATAMLDDVLKAERQL